MLEANKHILWFDNLFTTILLLETLREFGIGAAGTVRTLRTKREEQWDAEEEVAISGHRSEAEATASIPPSSQHSTHTAVVEAYHSQSISTGFSQSESLPLSLQRQRKSHHAMESLSSYEKFSDRLMSIKLTYNNRVVWGTQYWELSAKKLVIQLAWKDSQIVLFASTDTLPQEQVVWLRKRPAVTATGANITRKVFGDQPLKYLPIPTTVDCYNHGMGSVDQAAQLMTTYDT
ncbi:hypothetical protein HOY80DRAFT_1112950 [Tuber brumale]|nr:hypothetical protein HOY80DRAFT_1112950 [Tuber brumale]